MNDLGKGRKKRKNKLGELDIDWKQESLPRAAPTALFPSSTSPSRLSNFPDRQNRSNGHHKLNSRPDCGDGLLGLWVRESPPRRALLLSLTLSCRKSSVGLAVAQALAVPFCDGDDLHPASNVAKMASGNPLNDEVRSTGPQSRRGGACS